MVSASLIVALALVLPHPMPALLRERESSQCLLLPEVPKYGKCSSEFLAGRKLVLIRHHEVDKIRATENEMRVDEDKEDEDEEANKKRLLSAKVMHLTPEGRNQSVFVGVGLANFTGMNVSEACYFDKPKDTTVPVPFEFEAQVAESAIRITQGWGAYTDEVRGSREPQLFIQRKSLEEIDDVIHSISNGTHTFQEPSGHVVILTSMLGIQRHLRQIDRQTYSDLNKQMPKVKGTMRARWSPFMNKHVVVFTCEDDAWSMTWPSLMGIGMNDARFSWLHKGSYELAGRMS